MGYTGDRAFSCSALNQKDGSRRVALPALPAVMRRHATRIFADGGRNARERLIDTCGTGGRRSWLVQHFHRSRHLSLRRAAHESPSMANRAVQFAKRLRPETCWKLSACASICPARGVANGHSTKWGSAFCSRRLRMPLHANADAPRRKQTCGANRF